MLSQMLEDIQGGGIFKLDLLQDVSWMRWDMG